MKFQNKNGCTNTYDSKLAQDIKNYYFCCYNKNALVDGRDCKKCILNQYREK